MDWKPPEDAVEWTPPSDAVAVATPEELIANSHPQAVTAYSKAAEGLSRTPALGIGEHTAAAQIPPHHRELFKALAARQYAQDQTTKNIGYGGRLLTSAVQGAVDFGMPLAKMVGAVPSLDPEQERFKHELLAIRESTDPTVRKEADQAAIESMLPESLKPYAGYVSPSQALQGAARTAFPMLSSIAAGKATGGLAGPTASTLSKWGATALGTSGAFLPQIADQTHSDLVKEGVPSDRAWKITAVSAPIEAAIESILPDPLSPYATAFKGTVRQVAKRIIGEAAKNYGKELSEEFLQGITNETAMEVGRRMDEAIPDQGLGAVLTKGVTAMLEATGPLAVMMGPGAAVGAAQTAQGSAARAARLAELKSIRASAPQELKQRAAEVGITGSRNEVRKQLDSEINQLNQEQKHASTVRSDQAEVRGGQVESGPDLRGNGQVEVPAQPAGKGAAGRSEVPPVEPASVPQPPTQPQTAPEAVTTQQPSESLPTQQTQPQEARSTGTKPESAKYSWQMTRSEFEQTFGSLDKREKAVKDAIDSGKPVPPEVLADFPNLASKTKKSSGKKANEPQSTGIQGILDRYDNDQGTTALDAIREIADTADDNRISEIAKQALDEREQDRREFGERGGSDAGIEKALEDIRAITSESGQQPKPAAEPSSEKTGQPETTTRVVNSPPAESAGEAAPQEPTKEPPAFEPVSTPPRVTPKDDAWRQELREQAANHRERERQLEKQREAIQKQHDATRRNAHKKRGEFQKQIRALGTEEAANARSRRKLEAEARLMSIEDALESPASELHRLAGVAELQNTLATRERDIAEEEWSRVGQKEEYRASIRESALARAKVHSDEAAKHYHNLRVVAEGLARDEGLSGDEASSVADRAIRDFTVTSRSSLHDIVKSEAQTQRRVRADLSMPSTTYLQPEKREAFEKRFRQAAEDDAGWFDKQEAVKKEMAEAEAAAKREHEAGAAERAKQAAEEAKIRQREAAIEERQRRKLQAANDRYFRQASERAKSLNGETEKNPLSKGGEPQGSITKIGKWTIDEAKGTASKEGRFAIIHSPSGETAARAGSMVDAKLLIQMMRDAEIEIADNPKSTNPAEQKRFNELVHAWDTGYLGTSDVGKHLAGMVEVPDAGVTGDIVLDASDLIPKGETEIHGRLKNFIDEVPEFAYNPVFTVNEDRNLVFHDGYKFAFAPSLVGLDDSLIEPGQTVALNLPDVGIERPSQEEVVKAVLGREFAVKSGGKKQGGLLLKMFGSKSGDTVKVSGGGHNWSVTNGSESGDGKRAQQLLDRIPWTRSKQIAKNEQAAEEDTGEGEGVASFGSSPNPTRQTRSYGEKNEAPPIAAADIQKTAQRIFGVAIRHGGFSQRAAGIYKWLTGRKTPPSPEVVRTGEAYYAGLGVVAHEVAHHIDEKTKAVRGMPKDVREEIKKLDYEPQKARPFEGWAEFLRRYMTEPALDVNGQQVPNPGIDAPQTLAWFEGTFLPAHPDVAQAINEFRGYAQQWAQQSVFQRLGSMIAERQPQDVRFKEAWLAKQRRLVHRLKTTFIDKFHTLEWIQQAARKKGHKGVGIYDLTMAHFLSASSHATTAFEEGVRSIRDGRLLGKTTLWGLRDHLEADSEYEDAVLYALARHTLFMQEKKPGYNTGIDVGDAEAWLKEVEDRGQTDRFEEFAKGLARFNNDMLKMLVDAGALPQDQAENMLRYYGGGNYFPLHRVRDANMGMFAGTGAGFVNLGKAVKGRSAKGSGRQIIDPIDATVAQAIRFYGRAIQARQQHVLAETLDPKLGGVGGMGGLMDRIDPRKKVTQGNIEEILGTLVEEGVVDADDAKAMRIAAQIRNPAEAGGFPSEKSLKWFAERHGIEEQDGEFDAGALDEAAGKEPDALAVISLWRPDYTPSAAKRTVIIYDKQGKPLMYEMDPDLYSTATGMDELQFGPFMSVFREAARWFKTGAVGASTGFGTANLLRDYWEFQGKAQHVKGLASLGKPPQMLGRYIAEKARKLAGQKANDPLIRLYEESGGKVYSIIGHDVESRRRYRRRRMGKSVMSKLGIAVERPGQTAENALQAMMDVIAVSDAPPRLADAEAAIRADGFEVRNGEWFDIAQNKPVKHLPEHVRIKAAIAMAEATINFKRIGTAGQYVESFMPFFNATVQATYRQYQQAKQLKSLGKKDVEGARAARTIVYLSALAAASAAVWMLRHKDDDWREQEPWLRDGYWTWGANGKTYIRIPKPRDWGVLSNIVENMLDAWYHEDARDTTDVVLRDLGGRLPTGGGFVRGAIETYVADYDYFRGRPLTPDYLKDLPKEQQITPYTSSVSDAAGKVTGRYLNTSPIQVEHLLNSASGGFYHRMTDLYDAAQQGRLGPEHVPFLRGLVIDRHQARSLNDFYQKLDDLQTQAYREKAADGKVSDETTRKQAVLDGHAEMMTAIRELEGKVGKRRDYQYQPYLVGLARSALGYSELQGNPNPLTDKDSPVEIKEVVRKYSQNAVLQATETLKDKSEYKDEDTYETERKSRVRGEAKLKATGVSFAEADQLLKAHYHELDKHGRTTMTSDERKSYNAKLKKLKELYGE